MAQETLLDLSTEETRRAHIKIDGKAYELRSRDEFGLKQDAEFRRFNRELSESHPEKDWQKIAGLLNQLVQAVVVDLPDEVLAKLSDAKKMRIVEVFTKEVVLGRDAASAGKEAVA